MTDRCAMDRAMENDIQIEGFDRNGSGVSEDKDSVTPKMKEPLLTKANRINTTSQLAIVGAIVCPIESLDYEIADNDQFKQDWISRTKTQIFQYVVLKWTLALLIGLGTGLVGFFKNLAVENIAGFKLLLSNNLMLQNKFLVPYSVLLLDLCYRFMQRPPIVGILIRHDFMPENVLGFYPHFKPRKL